MSDFARRHYEAVAEILKENTQAVQEKLVDSFVALFESDTDRFDRERFEKAVRG
jgi:hypothetical protein